MHTTGLVRMLEDLHRTEDCLLCTKYVMDSKYECTSATFCFKRVGAFDTSSPRVLSQSTNGAWCVQRGDTARAGHVRVVTCLVRSKYAGKIHVYEHDSSTKLIVNYV